MAKKLTIILLCLFMALIAATAITLGLVYEKNDGTGGQQGTEQDGPSSSTGGSADGSSGNNENTDGSGNGGNNNGNEDNTGNGSNGGSGSGDNTGSGNNGGSDGGAHTCKFTFNMTVAPECTKEGYDVYLCSTCGTSERRNRKPALNHDYEWTEHKATCVTDWSRDGVCRRCKDTKTETVPDSTTGHNYNWTVIKPASCTQDGSRSGSCPDCSATTVQAIPRTGHSFGRYIFNNNAQCETDGTESATCSNCNSVYTRTVVGSKTGHSYGKYVSNNDATCTKDGTSSRTCATCQKVDTITVPNSKIPHNFVKGTCSVCGEKADPSGLVFTDYATYSEVTSVGTATGDIVIPATHNGLPVTGFGWIFNSREDITSLVIPDSVTELPADALFGCKNLKKVVMKGVTHIGENAFWKCANLESITIGKNVTEIERYAFAECYALKEIIFEGTRAEWNAVVKETEWDYRAGNYTVKCSDGTI